MKFSLFLALKVFLLYISFVNCKCNTGDFPFVVYIPLSPRSYNPSANLRCAGVLVNEKYVLTSSLCLQHVIKTIQLGRYDTSKSEDAAIEIEVDTWTKYQHSDLALLKLKDIVQFTSNVSPASFHNQQPAVSAMYTSGWGLTSKTGSPSTVKKVVQHTLMDCKNLSPHTLCITPKNNTNIACNGDEGSPIVYCENEKWVVYGVLSSVFDDDQMPCAEHNPATGILLDDQAINWVMDKIRQ